MSLSFKDLPGGVPDNTQVWLAEVAICQTLAQADSLSSACRSYFGNEHKCRVLTFAAGYWFVVLFVHEIVGDTDVTHNNA